MFLKSNLDGLSIDVGEVFEPSTYVESEDGKITTCPNLIYYNKNGALNWDDGISVNRRRGTIRGEKPGKHKVIALCIGLTDSRLSRDFDVTVNYAKAKELSVSLNTEKVYVGSYVPLSYKITDDYGFTRYDANIKIKSDNNLVAIDDLNNVKAINPGKTKLIISLDDVETSISFNIIKNPIEQLSLTSNMSTARTGDVVTFNAKAYDKKNKLISDSPIIYSYSGESFDKSNTASALINENGKFVAETAGKYLITATAGQRSSSTPFNVYDKSIQREIVNVGSGTVEEKHTSNFWGF
jgi:hypothetical protein